MPDIDRQLFECFCDAMPLGVCLVDLQGKIFYWNAAAEAITGYLSHDVLGRPYRGDLLIECGQCAGNRQNGLLCPVKEVLRDGRAVVADLYLRHKEGHRVPVHVDAFPLRDSIGEVRGVAEILDVSQGKQEVTNHPLHSEREFEIAAGLPAVAESREHLRMMLQSPYASSSALILIEISKHDTILQHGGTAMLRQAIRVLARTIAGLLPPRSYVGCWSDERLVALVPECNHQTIEELKAKLARIGSSCAVKWWGDRVMVGIGAAARFLDSSQSVDALIQSLQQDLKSGTNGEE